MKKTNNRYFFTGVALVFLLGACSSPQYPMKDGYYTAEAEDYDQDGWKEYVTVYISHGHIALVEYNGFNTAGLVKSWDMNFMREMNAHKGTYPNSYIRYYGAQLLQKQGTGGIDSLSGATNSGYAFIELADAALEKARLGDTETCLVKLSGHPGAWH
ncbi:MAG: FMN-binding protein [Treponema sp.]|nr:FMN-binding protein [Treponema sp.]